MIYMRLEWYLNYVKNLVWILFYRFKLNLKNFDLFVFEKMVKFVVKNNCFFKGIIDYEIVVKRCKKEVFILVYYFKINRFFVFVDVVYNLDYLDIVIQVLENIKKYLKELKVKIFNDGNELYYGKVKIYVRK